MIRLRGHQADSEQIVAVDARLSLDPDLLGYMQSPPPSTKVDSSLLTSETPGIDMTPTLLMNGWKFASFKSAALLDSAIQTLRGENELHGEFTEAALCGARTFLVGDHRRVASSDPHSLNVARAFGKRCSARAPPGDDDVPDVKFGMRCVRNLLRNRRPCLCALRVFGPSRLQAFC